MPRKPTPKTPAEPPPPPAPPTSKLDLLAALLSRLEGATVVQMVEASGWQAHSVRGAMSGLLKTKRKLIITSTKADGVRTYRAAPAVNAETQS